MTVTYDRVWFSPGSPVSSGNKSDCHNIAEILLKLALNTIKQTNISKLINIYASVSNISVQLYAMHWSFNIHRIVEWYRDLIFFTPISFLLLIILKWFSYKLRDSIKLFYTFLLNVLCINKIVSLFYMLCFEFFTSHFFILTSQLI